MDSDYDKGCLAGPQGSVLDISVKEDNPNYDAPVVSDNEDITPGMEGQIKEWLESYRPVRQRTVRSETTKDKAGALPPAVYAVHHTDESEERLRYPEENTVSSANAQRVVSIQFVDDMG